MTIEYDDEAAVPLVRTTGKNGSSATNDGSDGGGGYLSINNPSTSINSNGNGIGNGGGTTGGSPTSADDDNENGKLSFEDGASSDDDDNGQNHKTTIPQTFIHLIKGYIGPGCLSLPWAVSQLGIPLGFLAIALMAFWSSYNCWIVVKLKRYIERTRLAGVGVPSFTKPTILLPKEIKEINNQQQQPTSTTTTSSTSADAAAGTGATAAGAGTTGAAAVVIDESDARSSVSGNSSVATSNVTYPDVGEWAYGKNFQSYIASCVCVQQLSICTVFFSFVGENVLAVLQRLPYHIPYVDTHGGVITLSLPLFLSLSFLPNIKTLSPVMAAGTVTLLIGFALLGLVIGEEWGTRHENTPAELNLPQMPLAVCAILYSYEGICLILPVESAMKEPEKFKSVFTISMTVVAIILGTVSSLCVLAFGNVTNGSVTAFLLESYRDDESITWLLMLANLMVSVSVLFTYPLQLFPAVELVGPIAMSNKFFKRLLGRGGNGDDIDDDDDDDLSAFEPLPPITEGEVASLGSLPSQHSYGALLTEEDAINPAENNRTGASSSANGGGGGGGDDDNAGGFAYWPKRDKEDNDDDDEEDDVKSIVSMVTSIFPEMQMPGDSPLLRLWLVLLTYTVAVVIPNVQALISLAGALAGSSTALLIPPLLELSWIRHLENGGDDLLLPQEREGGELRTEEESRWMTFQRQQQQQPPSSPGATKKKSLFPSYQDKWFFEKMKSYILLGFGILFCGIGTAASLADIFKAYLS